MRETAARVLGWLRDTVLGRLRPVGALRNDGQPLSSANMRTEAGPMAELQALAQLLIRPPLLDVSVFGGFAYANSSHIGASAMAWADGDPAAAQAAVDTLCQALAQRQADFDIPLLTPAQGLELALRTPGLVAVTDPADNPLSGGIGDTPELLRALLRHGLQEPTVYASLTDPGVVRAARAAGVGAVLDLRLGGRRTADFGLPVPLRATVERLTDGHFVNTGPMERGSPVECGDTVVLSAGPLRLIVTTHVAPCNDPAFFVLHGIDLAQTRLLCVKAKNHFRAAFQDLCQAIVDVDAPGPATLNLAQLPLRRRSVL
jgi:microcystin degradation protein MlrC